MMLDQPFTNEQTHILKIIEENKKLKEALWFYADKDNWQMLNSGAPTYRKMNLYDSEKIENAIFAGKLARKTLQDLNN